VRDQREGAGPVSPKRLDVDPQLELELAVCAEYRIRHSEFLSWDIDDRDKAIAFHIRKRMECGRCGTRPEEWDETRGGHRYAYIADHERCLGCERIEAGRAALTGDEGRGVRIVLKPNPNREEATRAQP
jgi:hypothetical protein